MKRFPRTQLFVFCLIVGAVCQLLFNFMVHLIDEEHYAHQRIDVTNKLSQFRLQLEQKLNSTFYITRGLEILIASITDEGQPLAEQQDKVEFWAKTASQSLPYIRNVGLSEGYTIQFVHPRQGNEAIIGKDYRNLPRQWPAVQRAIQTRLPVVAGPLTLMQGGKGIICRIPLFSGDDGSQKGEFVGVVSLVVDYDTLMQSVGLDEVEQSLSISIRGKNGLGEKGDVFYGEHSLFGSDSATQQVGFLGGEWLLAAKPTGGWAYESPHSSRLSLLGYLVSLAVVALTYFAIRGAQLRIETAQHFTRELENKVEERTRQLSLAKNEAERANKAKSDFLAVMTHELRTPLNSILGLTQLVETMDLGKLQREYVGKVLTSANLLLGLINNILSYSKMESGEDVVKPEAFMLSALLKKMSDVFETPATKKGVDFIIETGPDLPKTVECDKGKLLQVLTNLCGNAIKFTELGSVKLSVSRVADSDKTSGLCRLKFVVSDTGIGIDEASQRNVFNPFSQIDSSISRQYQGTGLGLNICKSFVEMMQGRIGVESQLGRGSQFWFEIPLSELEELKDASDSTTAQKMQLAVAKSEPLLSGMTVILAEDNQFNQTLAVALLKKVGLNIRLAENGLEVLAILEQESVHGILMDVQMPKLDGIATTEKLRADSRFATLPIIAMTANAMEEDQQQILAAGMSGFVAKPIDFEHLYEVLSNKLSRDSSYPD